MSANIGAEKVRMIAAQIEQNSKDKVGPLGDLVISLNSAYAEFVQQLTLMIPVETTDL